MWDDFERGAVIDYFSIRTQLLQYPVLSAQGEFVTIAMKYCPRAAVYALFEDQGWELFGPVFRNSLALSWNNPYYHEVTFRKIMPWDPAEQARVVGIQRRLNRSTSM